MRKRSNWPGLANNIPLNLKFTLIYIFCVLVPILTINVLFFREMSENIEEHEQAILQLAIERSAQNVTDMIEGGVTLSYSVATDRVLYEALDQDYEDEVSFYINTFELLNGKMRPFISAYTYVENITVYTENPTIVSGSNYFELDYKTKRSPWFELVRNSNSDVNVIMYRDADPMNINARKEYLSIIRKLNEYPMYGQYDKYLRIDLKLNNFNELLELEKPYMNIKMIDPHGRILFPSSQFMQEHTSTVHEENKNLLFNSPLGNLSYIEGWQLVGVVAKDRFQTAILSSKNFIWLVAAISTLLPTWLIFVMFRSYNYRIRRLARHMDKATNEKFDLIELREGKDEIGGLIRSYNRMASQIESLINDVYKLEIQQKDMQLEQIRAEMKLLQSQVNPHFLFNTLNALLVVSAKNNYSEVTVIIRNLSQLLRRMLSWTDETVPLQEELHFTDIYLNIEKFRFADKFNYSFEISEEAKQCLVPKMCIQPLVENACKHGLQAVKGQRNIRIEATRDDKYLFVRVIDNGKGMDETRLAELRSMMNESLDSGENIGMRNVYKRLRLHYMDRADFYIASSLEEGTCVSFRIPALTVDEGGRSSYVYGATSR